MRWLHKLTYRFGKYYIQNLMTVVVVGMAIVYLADMFFSPSGVLPSSFLTLNTAAILKGQVWRLITFVFVYPSASSLFLIFSLYFYYMMGRLLENGWGASRLTLYYLFGIAGAILGAFAGHFLAPLLGIRGGVSGSNTYLNLSLFLAFAAIAPDTEFRLFFILPIKAKWMVIAYAVMLGIPLLQAFLFVSPMLGLLQLVMLVFSLINYLLFFGQGLLGGIRQQMIVRRNRRQWRNKNR